jgi:hypothetical protein
MNPVRVGLIQEASLMHWDSSGKANLWTTTERGAGRA